MGQPYRDFSRTYKSLPKTTYPDLADKIREGILAHGKKHHIGLRMGYPRCLILVSILNEKKRPMRFMEIVNEAKWSSGFDLKTSGMKKSIQRPLDFLIFINIVGLWEDEEGTPHYYLKYRIVSLPDRRILKEKSILKTLTEDIATIKSTLLEINNSLGKCEQCREDIKALKDFLENRFGTRIH
ncbi:MAG: hypothetical protein GXO65_06580 [Euryarchaeota archaeon]|nr:hypothetical protein [Euryarchaeota archaeon]